MHAVGVQDHQRAQRHFVALELVLAAIGVLARVRHGESDVGLAGRNQLEVIDRTARHLGRRLHARNVFRQEIGEPAAERVVHAAGAAGRDRQAVFFLGMAPAR